MIKKIITILLILLAMAGCTSKESPIIENADELNGKNMGCMSGSIFDVLIEKTFPDSDIIYFGSRSELLLGLTTSKIDGFVSDEPVAMMMVKQNGEVTYLDEAISEVHYGICFSNENLDKLDQFNEYLDKLDKSGELKRLQEKWINPDGTSQKKEEYELDGRNRTIRCVTTPDAAPFSFMSNNTYQGYEAELLYGFCHEYGYDIEISTVSFDALLTSVAMNKYDVAFNGIYITEERAKSVNFCTSSYTGRVVVMIRNGAVNAENRNLIESIKDSFYKNFIEEDRYMLLLKGAGVTVLISFLSIVFGTLLGLAVYMLSTENATAKKIFDSLQKILAKLPAVVLLMLLFYVVFKTSSIKANTVSIIGFSIIFGFTFYGLLKSGIASIDKGQEEATMALGFEKWIAFFHIILPQALKVILDTYLGEVIALIKNTSIVGYVSVSDLTRASDIIRGRTYDALFPLIFVALVYYLLCTLETAIVKIPFNWYINKKVNYRDKI
ncbi:MAG: ABC transporter substrate-binding protein/permease [Erysipelotrichaceae bacterium]|nr:ABC transporter substrate-binding protein/permease [Erysipelotrichaceae bacterium]